jgi:NDP-sugar pyrophosphorylase family protein
MLLAAGVGERMLPITRVIPKPLIPVLGRPLGPQILSRLALEGIDEAVINLHHLRKSLREAFGDGSPCGLRALHYSLEESRLLGTGGGLSHASPLLRGAGTILVRNSDFLTDIALAEVVAHHKRSGCPATIVVAPHRAGYTPVEVDDRNRVLGFGANSGGRFLFTGYHVIEESVLDEIPADVPSDIVRGVYVELAARGMLNAYVHDGFWWEFGDPTAYLEGTRRLIELPSEDRSRLGDFDGVRPVGDAIAALGPGAEVDPGQVVLAGTVAVGMGAMVGDGSRIEDTVIMPEAWVGPQCSLQRCIIGPGTELPIGFSASDAIVVADAGSAEPLPTGVERDSGLLIKPIPSGAA